MNNYYIRLCNVRSKYLDTKKYRIEVSKGAIDNYPVIVVYDMKTDDLLYVGYTSKELFKNIIVHLLLNYREVD